MGWIPHLHSGARKCALKVRPSAQPDKAVSAGWIPALLGPGTQFEKMRQLRLVELADAFANVYHPLTNCDPFVTADHPAGHLS